MMAAEMTPKQRILAAYLRQDIDRPPVCPNLIRWIRGNYGCPCEMHQLRVMEEFGFDPLIVYGAYYNNNSISSDYVYQPGAAGGYRDLPNVNVDHRIENHDDRTIHIRRFETPDGVLTDRVVWPRQNMGYGDGPNPHRDEPLVKSMDDVPALKHLYPRSRKGFTEDLRMFTEMVGERGVVEYLESSNAGDWGMESLGPDKMLTSAVEDKELLHAVLRVCQDQHIRNLKEILESGHKNFYVSWFQSGPSVGWSPDNIREFFVPLMREGIELLHSYGGTYRWFDDGKMKDFIPELIEMGVDVICGLQPPPVGDCVLGDLKSQYARKVSFMGGLDGIYTFEFGSPQKVRAAVEKLLAEIGDGRGVIISTGEGFGPETPPELLHEWVQAVRRFGK